MSTNLEAQLPDKKLIPKMCALALIRSTLNGDWKKIFLTVLKWEIELRQIEFSFLKKSFRWIFPNAEQFPAKEFKQ